MQISIIVLCVSIILFILFPNWFFLLAAIGTFIFIIVRPTNKSSSNASKNYSYTLNKLHNLENDYSAQSAIERAKNPIIIPEKTFYTKVAGVSHDGRQSIICFLRAGMNLDFIREPHNPYDRNAIAIYRGDLQIGFIPRDLAAKVAPFMDNGAVVCGQVEEITGGGTAKYYGCIISYIIHEKTSPIVGNPLYKKTCVFIGAGKAKETENIIALGGSVKQEISSITDYVIVESLEKLQNGTTKNAIKAREMIKESFLRVLCKDEYESIKKEYLQK